MVKRFGLKWLATAFVCAAALLPLSGIAAADPDPSDTTAPVTTISAPSTWQNGPVTVSLFASDNESGVAATYYTVDGGPQQTGAVFTIETGGVHTIAFWSVDQSGNPEAPNTATVMLDLTSPTIQTSATTADNQPYTSGTWTNQAVTVSYLCADEGGSGLDYCPPPDVATDNGMANLSGYVSDGAGNMSYSDNVSVRIDRVPPTITATAETMDGMPYISGTSTTQNVRVTYRCRDEANGSGLASCPGPETFSAAGVAAGKALDNAGNVGTLPSPLVINIQKVTPPPTITATVTTADGKPYHDGDWTNQSVTVAFACQNTVSCPAARTFSQAGTVNETVDNGAGVTANITLTINVDKTAPVITWAGNAGTYAPNDIVQITCTATDGQSGIAGSDCVNLVGPASSFGTGTIVRTATARDVAGNQTTSTVTFTVKTGGGGGGGDTGVAGFDDLCSLTKELVTKDGIGKSLCAKLNNAKAAFARGDLKTKDNIINAYIHEVDAQTGKAITKANADRLKAAAKKL